MLFSLIFVLFLSLFLALISANSISIRIYTTRQQLRLKLSRHLEYWLSQEGGK